MQIDRVLYPITSLGPGKRLAIWTQGCTKHCKNCASRELWPQDPDKEIAVPALVQAIEAALAGELPDGVTITGGDPFEQPEALAELVQALSARCEDILVYTGETWEQLTHRFSPDFLETITRHIAVLIDGPYIDELNDNAIPLRGSTNQRMLFFKEALRPRYAQDCARGRTVQNVYYEDSLMSVGIHNQERRNDHE